MRTAEAIDAFLVSRRTRNVTGRTIDYYEWCLAALVPHEDLPTDSGQIEVIIANASLRLGPESLRDLYRGLRIFYRWLCGRYEEVPNPIVRGNSQGQTWNIIPPPTVPKRLPKTLSSDELLALLTRGCISARDKALVLLVLDNGIRLGEIASLTKRDIGAFVLRVTGKRGAREVPVTAVIRESLMQMGDDLHPWIHFKTGLPLTVRGVQAAYRRIFHRADVVGGPHRLRHTFATEYLRHNGNLVYLQQILGHSDIQTTRIYLHIITQDLVREHRRSSPVKRWLAI